MDLWTNQRVQQHHGFFQIALADEVEVVKPNKDEISDHENEVDQVALESEQEPQSPTKVLYQHNIQQQQPGPARSNHQSISMSLGQPFGPPPPPSQLAYQGPPPPLPPQRGPQIHAPQVLPDLSVGASNTNEVWSSPVQDMPKIISLDVKCEKNGMKVFVQFDKPFYGIVFSKGHYRSNKVKTV
ncbi:bromodomain-containing protein 4-like [Teleopsis dalmanni]|uniref:bromodomain-containing protein 4-like n=1 Tax=Teleopsis dalmanni TaxID=139649 RepID=UPI0018CFAAC9|nr:bromodomain-containing protein 4-like [Teleopsis dalmanni]